MSNSHATHLILMSDNSQTTIQTLSGSCLDNNLTSLTHSGTTFWRNTLTEVLIWLYIELLCNLTEGQKKKFYFLCSEL